MPTTQDMVKHVPFNYKSLVFTTNSEEQTNGKCVHCTSWSKIYIFEKQKNAKKLFFPQKKNNYLSVTDKTIFLTSIKDSEFDGTNFFL